MSRLINIIGERFGRLVVIGLGYKDKWGHYYWLCLCDCGREKIIAGSSLKSGATKSCGCFSKHSHTKHGHCMNNRPSREYQTWNHMIQRCTNPNSKNYHYYGGRGIKICKRWLKFENFLADMGECPDGFSLDRKNNNKNYCKSNCRWATKKQQMRNMRSNRSIPYNGKIQCIAAWSEETGIPYHTLYYRIYKYGWPIEKH